MSESMSTPTANLDLRLGAVSDFGKLFKQSLVLGAFAIGGSLLAIGMDKRVFFSAYLQGYCFALSIPLGCLGLTLLHNLVGGVWGESLRQYWAAAIKTFPLMVLLFLPLLAGARDLYEWAMPAAAHDPILLKKAAYLNLSGFALRAIAYFSIWIVLGVIVRKNDRLGSRPLGWSGFGLVLFVLSCSFASFDWLMSLEPHWFSSIFGALFIAGSLVTTLSFLILLVRLRPSVLGPQAQIQLHDLGKLLFMSVMLWAYLSFSQYLIIWSAQLAEELPWYQHRSRGGWQMVGALLIAGHFVLPFLLLLSRALKKNVRSLSAVAILLIVMRSIDIWWLVVPAMSPGKLVIHWVCALLPLGIAALWFAAFLKQLPADLMVVTGHPGQTPSAKKVENVEPQDR